MYSTKLFHGKCIVFTNMVPTITFTDIYGRWVYGKFVNIGRINLNSSIVFKSKKIIAFITVNYFLIFSIQCNILI